jgi:dTDP-4-amino-4,6-dideoxygalactose transaminase
LVPLREPPGSVSNYYKYVVLLDPGLDRSVLKKTLREDFGVSLSGEVYATPLHREPVFAEFATAAYPAADDVCARQICMPIHSDMTEREVGRVVEAVSAAITRMVS